MGSRTSVGFVRGVMIGRDGLHRDVLLDIVERAGGAEATSYLATGNISFTADPLRLSEIVGDIEAGIDRVVERPTPVIVRTLDHLVALVARAPFDGAPHPDPKARLVAMVRDRVTADYHVFAVDGWRAKPATSRAWGTIESIVDRLDRRGDPTRG